MRKGEKRCQISQENPHICSNKAPISTCATSAAFSFYLPAHLANTTVEKLNKQTSL